MFIVADFAIRTHKKLKCLSLTRSADAIIFKKYVLCGQSTFVSSHQVIAAKRSFDKSPGTIVIGIGSEPELFVS